MSLKQTVKFRCKRNFYKRKKPTWVVRLSLSEPDLELQLAAVGNKRSVKCVTLVTKFLLALEGMQIAIFHFGSSTRFILCEKCKIKTHSEIVHEFA